ncbi:hypothetical protein SP41_125 [Salmonella phage 41]|nr:hypothetical protein SP41_125 [Salmonella phage 41]
MAKFKMFPDEVINDYYMTSMICLTLPQQSLFVNTVLQRSRSISPLICAKSKAEARESMAAFIEVLADVGV